MIIMERRGKDSLCAWPGETEAPFRATRSMRKYWPARVRVFIILSALNTVFEFNSEAQRAAK
jgi:hypothetical protein